MTVPFVYVFFLPSDCTPAEAEEIHCPEGKICMAVEFPSGMVALTCV